MTTFLPAPYESVADDDLAAAAVATLAWSLSALVAVSLGLQVGSQYKGALDAIDGGSLSDREVALVMTTIGWAAGAVLLALGALVLILRRGRGALLLGALLATVTTVVARYQFGYFTATHPLNNLPVFYAGALVIVFALLPATRRWIAGRGHSSTLPALTTATPLPPRLAQVPRAR